MANVFQFGMKEKILPILAPADIAATETGTAYVDLKDLQWASFLISLGAVTTGTATLTVEVSTAASSNATEAAVPFTYRLSSAVATDNWGDPTTATSAGATIATDADNKLILVELDPAALPSNPGEGHTFARLVISPTTDMAAMLVGVSLIGAARYPGAEIVSAT